MLIAVRQEGPGSVYGQIARQLREHIAQQRLPAGTVLPSVRALASDLGVSLNTVARAYRQLEREGFILIRTRSGATVLPPSREADGRSRGHWTRELRQLLARMRQAGFRPVELRDLMRREIRAMAATERTRTWKTGS